MCSAWPVNAALRQGSRRPCAWVTILLGLAAAACSLLGCEPQARATGRNDRDLLLSVGCAASAEQMVLGEFTALALEQSGYRVIRRFGLDGTMAVRKAMLVERIDICWDYTGDIWTSYLGHDYPIGDPETMYRHVREEDALNQVIWMPPADVQRTLGILTQQDTARKLGIYTLSDLATSVRSENPHLSLCTPQDLYLRPTGIRGLQRVYRFRFDEARVTFAPLETGYSSLGTGVCEFALGYPNEGALVADSLRALEDDQGYFMSSDLVVGIRAPLLLEAPELESILRTLAEHLAQDALGEASRRVSIRGAKPATVAKRLLRRSDWVPLDLSEQP